MIRLSKLREVKNPTVIMLGNHPGIIQSTLDFDYLAHKSVPSVIAIVGVRQRVLRYFWGANEIAIPGYTSIEDVPVNLKEAVTFFAVAQSGRRAVEASIEVLEQCPALIGGMIFAEGVPERHALRLIKYANKKEVFILGPASVGFLLAGSCKLGAIGGTLPGQIATSGITEQGSVAVISTSGGMINELITMVGNGGYGVSFAAAIGGERYPLTKPAELIEQALEDDQTKAIVFFGELGGDDEYQVAELIKNANSNKPVFGYIAGEIAEQFESAPQFGHAKAMAHNKRETATEKKKALSDAGVLVSNTFAQFEETIKQLPIEKKGAHNEMDQDKLQDIEQRQHSMFANSVSTDKGGEVRILGEDLISFVDNKSLSEVALNMFLGHKPKSKRLVEFFDVSLRLLVDHGPQVSGAVNTMITARAGKDLTSALASGLLTIGSRFGGAINEASSNWFFAVNSGEKAADFVERFAAKKEYIPGIGHKKYRVDNPDPRVEKMLAEFGSGGAYTQFARSVERLTTAKKAQLILNIDGLIGAMLLDILKEDEGYNVTQTQSLIDTEFCNAIFVYARTVGFIAHYLDQKRLDEGLFRLPDEHIADFYQE